MLDIFKENEAFFEQYLKHFAYNYTKNSFTSFLYYIATELKKENSNINVKMSDYTDLEKQALECNTNAINYLFKGEDEIGKLYPHHIQATAFLVNEYSGFSKGYRKTAVAIARGASFTPAVARTIPEKVLSLMDTYHNTWTYRDIFEREALLHIDLIRIQPFEDGNKRTAQLITSFNLLKNGYAPILIKEKEKEEYLNYIDDENVEGMAKFLKDHSTIELYNIGAYYEQYKKDKTITKKI